MGDIVFEKNNVTVGCDFIGGKFCFKKKQSKNFLGFLVGEKKDCRNIISLHRADPEEMDYLFEKKRRIENGERVFKFIRLPKIENSTQNLDDELMNGFPDRFKRNKN